MPTLAKEDLDNRVDRLLKSATRAGYSLQDVLMALARYLEDKGIDAGQEGDATTYEYLDATSFYVYKAAEIEPGG